MPLKVNFKHRTNVWKSTFKLRITIDHTTCVSNTLIPKLLIKQTKYMSCSKFVLIEGLNTGPMWIEVSLSTDTTELTSTNVRHKKQRRSRLNQIY